MPDNKKQLEAPELPNSPILKAEKWVEGNINQGMVTMIEASNLQPSQMQLVQNARVRFDLTTRRPGSKVFLPDTPGGGAGAVLALVLIKQKVGDQYTLRVMRNQAHRLAVGSWVPLTFTLPLNGTESDRLQFADILDNFIYSNNGADPIQKIDLATMNIAQLGNAPAYRYITAFNNRAVGFALRGVSEVQVGWSGDGDPTQWDPAIDETAGFTPLVDSPSDLSDFVKGGFGFTNVMVVLREKSTVLTTKQPVPTDPFFFYTAVPGIGCDCPFSAQIISNGLAWVDKRTKTVYAYSPGGSLEAIGRPIEKTLLDQVQDVNTVFSSFDAVYNEYSVYIPSVGTDFVKVWTFNFNTKAWTYNEYYQVTCAQSDPIVSGVGVIEGLPGTVEALPGTIESLSPATVLSIGRTYGRSEGTIAIEDDTTNTDARDSALVYPNGVPFNTILVSKTFKIPSNDIYIARTVIEYEADAAGDTFKLEYSNNNGKTWILDKEIVPTVFGQTVLFIFRRMFRARRFTWRLTSNALGFNPLGFEVWVYKSGDSRK